MLTRRKEKANKYKQDRPIQIEHLGEQEDVGFIGTRYFGYVELICSFTVTHLNDPTVEKKITAQESHLSPAPHLFVT